MQILCCFRCRYCKRIKGITTWTVGVLGLVLAWFQELSRSSRMDQRLITDEFEKMTVAAWENSIAKPSRIS